MTQVLISNLLMFGVVVVVVIMVTILLLLLPVLLQLLLLQVIFKCLSLKAQSALQDHEVGEGTE